jgi:hypothetical protein
VPEAAAGEMVVLHLYHQLRRQRFECPGALRAPAARRPWRPAREPRALAQRLRLRGQRSLYIVFDLLTGDLPRRPLGERRSGSWSASTSLRRQFARSHCDQTSSA